MKLLMMPHWHTRESYPQTDGRRIPEQQVETSVVLAEQRS
jgi:hypothetical protein